MIEDLRAGLVITNGSSALELTEHVDRDPRWKAAGWRGYCVGLEQYGGNVGYTDFVPDYLLGSWRVVPFAWTPVAGGDLEERYVWRTGAGRIIRQVRRFGEPDVPEGAPR